MSMVRFFRGANDKFANRERLKPQSQPGTVHEGPSLGLVRGGQRHHVLEHFRGVELDVFRENGQSGDVARPSVIRRLRRAAATPFA